MIFKYKSYTKKKNNVANHINVEKDNSKEK